MALSFPARRRERTDLFCFFHARFPQAHRPSADDSLGYTSWKERKAVAAALKPIYTAATAEHAEQELTEFEAQWGSRYPMIVSPRRAGLTMFWECQAGAPRGHEFWRILRESFSRLDFPFEFKTDLHRFRKFPRHVLSPAASS